MANSNKTSLNTFNSDNIDRTAKKKQKNWVNTREIPDGSTSTEGIDKESGIGASIRSVSATASKEFSLLFPPLSLPVEGNLYTADDILQNY